MPNDLARTMQRIRGIGINLHRHELMHVNLYESDIARIQDWRLYGPESDAAAFTPPLGHGHMHAPLFVSYARSMQVRSYGSDSFLRASNHTDGVRTVIRTNLAISDA